MGWYILKSLSFFIVNRDLQCFLKEKKKGRKSKAKQNAKQKNSEKHKIKRIQKKKEQNAKQNIKGPILSKLKFPGFFHDNRDLGAM